MSSRRGKSGQRYKVNPYSDGMAKYHAREQAKHNRLNRGLEDRIKQLESRPQAAAAAPAPAPPKPEPKKEKPKVDPSNYVQARSPSASRSGANFNKESTLTQRRELTDSYSQKKSYDPDAGIASPEAGNFLDDFKVDVKKNINSLRSNT